MTQLISATVPALFSMSFSADPVVLTPGAPDGGNLPFAGVINDVTVTDTRAGGNAWVLSGRVSDLSGPTGTLPGSAGYLGWDPALRPGAPSGVTAGPAVASSLASPAARGSPRPPAWPRARPDTGSGSRRRAPPWTSASRRGSSAGRTPPSSR